MRQNKSHTVVAISVDDIRRLTANGRWAKFRHLNSSRQRILEGSDVTAVEAHELEMAEAVYGPDWWQIYVGYQRLQWREARGRRSARLLAECTGT